MTTTKKTISVKRVAFISLIIIAFFAASILIHRLIVSNFVYDNPIFTGYGFHTNEDVQKITNEDMNAVTNLLDNEHISYKINDEHTYIYVQAYKWDEAVDVLRKSELDFDGCLIS